MPQLTLGVPIHLCGRYVFCPSLILSSSLKTSSGRTTMRPPHFFFQKPIYSSLFLAKCLYLGCRGSYAIQIVLLFHTINSCSSSNSFRCLTWSHQLFSRDCLRTQFNLNRRVLFPLYYLGQKNLIMNLSNNDIQKNI